MISRINNSSSILRAVVVLIVALLLSSNTAAHVSGMSTAPPSSSTGAKKLVLVTGGSRGIGRATCLLLASKGYQVALNYCTNKQAAMEVIADIETAGGTAAAFKADVSDESQVSKLFQDVCNHFDMAPTGLVNNAAVMESMEKDVLQITKETLERDFRVNTCGPFFCTKEFVKRASTKHGGTGGNIVCVSSISAESAQILAYGMCKAALEAMVTGLSKNLPLEGIRINTIQPGLIDTGSASPEIMQTMSGFIPLRRPGRPEEVAKAIEYLLSDESSYCSGSKLRISGGL
jgi:NAD(P)-dependent dehydrogenase (short-subunit alcohol dehydrogenase family)